MGFNEDFDAILISPNQKPRTPANANVVALCFHDEEYPEKQGAARDVARFFQDPGRQASTTGVIDDKEKVGCVPYGSTAWHSGAGDPWNYMIEGYEHSGYAAQTTQEWLDDYGKRMLDVSAEHFAKRCHALGIPPRKIDAEQLKIAIQSNDPSKGGIVGHHDITLAVPVPGGHTDPGPNFPWDYYISRVQFFFGEGIQEPQQEEDIVATKEELEQVVNAAADKIIAACKPGDEKWMGTSQAEGKIYIVSNGVKYHVPSPNLLQTLEFLGFDNRGVQDTALAALPEQPWVGSGLS